MIRRMLSLPLALLNELADETVTCLKCVENDNYLFVNGNDQINLLLEILSTRVSLRFFHEHRITVVNGVSKIIATVCLRAFNDILRRVLLEKAAGYEVGESSMAAEWRNNPLIRMYHPHDLNVPPFYPPPPAPPPPPPPRTGHHTPTVVDAYGIPVHMLAGGGFPGGNDSELQRQMLSDELGDHLLSRNLLLEINGEFEGKILPDDRTIFLTFSKGYPITEAEVREFFTK